MNQPPAIHPQGMMSPNTARFVRNIVVDLILTLFTFGLWNLVVQYRQMQAVNYLLHQDKYKFLPWLLLSLITCGLYHIYHEYRKSHDVAVIAGNPNSDEPILNVVLTVLGLWIVADAIQQAKINEVCGSKQL